MDKFNEKQFKRLITKFKNTGFETCFQELYEKYNMLIFKIAYSITKNKEDSEDVVQSVFSKIYTMPKESLPSRHFFSWLYSISKNESISLLRKKKNAIDLDSIYEITDNNDELNNIIDSLEFNRIIDGLNDRDKEIISLKILTNLSFSEISALLNEPSGTIKWRYYKSIHSLKLTISSLGMSVLAFIIGLKLLFTPKKSFTENQKFANSETKPDNSNNRSEPQKSENLKLQDSDTLNKTFTNNNIDEKTQTEVEISSDTNSSININYYSIGFFSVSAIFLIIFSFFLIKHQLKLKSKTSK